MSQKKSQTPAITPLGWVVLGGIALFVFTPPLINYVGRKFI